jgi:predicted amidohydrolase
MKKKVAATQAETFLEADEQTKNIEKAREYIAEAARQGVQFVCFPETYPGPWKAPLSYSPVEPLWEMAKKHDVYIAAGANCPVLGAEHGLAMICSPEEIVVESTKQDIFIAECDIDRIRWLRKERDLYGPPMPWNAKPGVLRDAAPSLLNVRLPQRQNRRS